ncbi:hypothetical protein A7K94_0211980 [Modestobacter sp. VKM Ac-2676]|nr:hypothetical protein A7K94_0211980 [Modestobacter sp. VKM Ac-2676]
MLVAGVASVVLLARTPPGGPFAAAVVWGLLGIATAPGPQPLDIATAPGLQPVNIAALAAAGIVVAALVARTVTRPDRVELLVG